MSPAPRRGVVDAFAKPRSRSPVPVVPEVGLSTRARTPRWDPAVMKDGEVPNLAGSDSWREQPFRPVIRISLGKRRSMKMVNTRVPRYFAAKSLYYDSRVAAMATAVDDPPNQQPRRTTAQRSAGREAPTTERQVARTDRKSVV